VNRYSRFAVVTSVHFSSPGHSENKKGPVF
jgi:hypothetical protein